MKNLLISLLIGAAISSVLDYFYTIPNGSAGVIITMIFTGIAYIYLSLIKRRIRKKRTFLQDKIDKNKFKNEVKLHPENNWLISIENKILTSIDWEKNLKTIDLNKIKRFYVRTTNEGPLDCDVWYGIETIDQSLEIPQGAEGENQLLNFTKSLKNFELKGMNSIENKLHECWKNEANNG